MNTTVNTEGVRIDSDSQLILRALRGGQWVRGQVLRDQADLEENQQVFYRMDKYLIPAGLVEERQRADSDEMRRFRLTEGGAHWVEDHAEELLRPTTREEIQEYALEGYREGTSAKESVQNYRKKLNRIKNHTEDLREEVQALADHQDSDRSRLDILEDRAQDNRDRSKETKQTVEELTQAVEARATTETVEGLDEAVSAIERRLNNVECKQAGIVRQQGQRERERALLARLARPAGYAAVGALGAYAVLVLGVALAAPGLLTGVVLAGVVATLAMIGGIGAVIYAQGATSADLSQSGRRSPSPETTD